MMRFIKLLGFLALVISSEASPRRYHHSIPSKSLHKKLAEPDYRLSPDVTPSHYKIDLTLEANFTETKVFSGNVEIQFAISNKAIKTFQIHINNIEVVPEDVTLLDITGKKIDGVTTSDGSDDATDFFTIISSEDLAVSPKDKYYTLQISYTGHLSETDMMGFYLSSYKDAEDNVKYLATTHFEEVGARRAFPCFDEPAMKAIFEVSITYPEGYEALSNTKAGPETNSPTAGLKKVIFPATPAMSTYLVAFIVSEFTCTNGVSVDETISTQVCSRPNTDKTRNIAVSQGPIVLQAMEDFTGLPFSKDIGKLTQAAIPDFLIGAMENWGMVTFREADLLYDADESSNAYQQTVTTVVTHELSHQWFGDKVTLSWWSDIFLNEGFATYFEYHLTDLNKPEWELQKQFVVAEVQTALLTDSSGSALPLHYDDSDNPDVISGRFDDISYNKGGSVLRMVHHFLGLELFQKGLGDYVKAYDLGTPELLWASFDKAANVPDELATVMDSWINKPGYPLLSVSTKGNNLTITQEAFVLSGDAPDTKWYVPISYTVDTKTEDFTNTTTKVWLQPNEDLTVEGVMKGNKWIILNNQQTGYYRVNYDKNLWNKISTALKSDNFGGIDVISRSQIVDDLLNLARAGKKDYSDVLKLLSFLKKDDSYYSWYPAFNGFDYLLQRSVDANVRKELTKYITDLTEALLKSAPIDKETPTDQLYSLRRVLALTWACKLNVKECVDAAKKQFADFNKEDGSKKPTPNMRSIVYCHGLRNSDDAKKDYDFLWNQYVNTDLATERVTMLKALGCSKDAAVRKEYLKTALTENVRIQDITYVFSSVYSNNPEGVDDVLDFIKESYKDFETHFGHYSDLSNLIVAVGDFLTTQDQIKKLQDFSGIADLDTDVKNAATAAIATANTNLKITKDLDGKLKDYFDSPAPSSAYMNNYQFVNIAFVLVGYIFYNFH